MEFLIIAMVIGLLPAAIAKHKGRSFLAWWFYGTMLWIIVLPISICMKSNSVNLKVDKSIEGTRKCPLCAEIIQVDAAVCRYCKSEIGILTKDKKISLVKKQKEQNYVSGWFTAIVIIGSILGFILYGIYSEPLNKGIYSEPVNNTQELKAKDSLVKLNFSWEKCRGLQACWKVHVWNQSNKAIKDIHFKMNYYSKSKTVIDTGEETIYEILAAGEKRWFEFDEFLRDQVVSASVTIDNAKWIDEKGETYLDW